MKKTLTLALIFSLFYLMVPAQSQNKSKYIKPTGNQKRVTTIVSGKSRSYYSLSTVKASVISVSGPGKLQLLSRGRFAPDQQGKLSYEIFYVVDGGVQKSFKASSVVRSTKATYQKGTLGVPGELKNFEIVLGRGDHTIEVKVKDTTAHVAIQYLFTPTKEKKRDWIEFSPLNPIEPVQIVSKESSVSYYRFSASKPVKIEVIGPTELRVLTRVEYQYQMRGRVNYRVQVKEDGKIRNTYQLSTSRSESAEYKTDKTLVPGKACEFVINVPSGKHLYELVPLDKDKNTVVGRFLLPKKDTKLESKQ